MKSEAASESWPRHAARRRPAASFFLLSFAFSWAIWVPMALRGEGSHLPGLLGPLAGALTATWLADGRTGLADLAKRMIRWRAPAWRFLLVVLSPFLLLAVAWPLAAAVQGGWPDLGGLQRMDGWPDAGWLGLFALMVLVVGFGEETGWRGFAIHRLEPRHGPLVATLVVTLFWALWHAPVFFFVENFRELGPGATVGWVVGLVAGSAVLTWIYLYTSRSVLAVAVWHGAFNMAAASEASEGLIAAIVTTAVMFWGFTLFFLWIRRRSPRPMSAANVRPFGRQRKGGLT